MAERIDLDELAHLEEERDFLLRSIDDLDREHAAGDVDPEDYQELRDGYVARAAAAIRAVEAREDTLAAQRDAAPPRRGRALLWVGVVVGFGVVAGVLLAGALGSRGSGGLTGGASPSDEADRCRSLSFQKPAEGITCYAKVLKDRPDDVDALTYQGWAKVRSGDVAGGSALFDKVVALDPKFPDVHVFRASVRKNAGDFAGAQAELDTLYSLNPSPLVVSTLQQMGLDTEVAEGLLPADVGACWTKEKTALAEVDAATSVSTDKLDRTKVANAFADLAIAVSCLDDIAKVRTDDVDNLRLRSLAVGLLGLIDESAVPKAKQNVDRVLELTPNDPAALLLRAVWRDRLGDLAGATADLDALGDRRVWPLVGNYVDAASVRAEVAAASAATTTTAP
ncbi:MAG: hypothetical protein U0Q22_10730 [Acidimicrobiales bacterium]